MKTMEEQIKRTTTIRHIASFVVVLSVPPVCHKCDISLLLSGDSSLEGVGPLGGRRSSSGRFSSKKSRQSQSLDDARQEIHELHHSLNSHTPLR